MPTPGYFFRDGGATPPLAEDPNSEFRRRITNATKPVTATAQAPLGQATSDSHKLATENHAIGGAVEEAGRLDTITNLGWQANAKGVDTLVGGLSNEDLWTLIRRFNKQMYHVKAIPVAPPGGLDLYIADEDEFSPDKLRANIERLYMTIGIGVIGFGKHIARLRSWREPGRTGAFAAGYFFAWLSNILVPVIFATLILLITVPESRDIMFPPAPLALVDSHTGGVQSPKAGVLGSLDSATGAPEKYKGEAVEQEASNLVSGIASVAISSAAGRHDQSDPDEDGGSKTLDKSAPDPTKMGSALADASNSASGNKTDPSQDKTKQPMEEAIWSKMRPAMHALGDLADGWERFANALSPTTPFPDTVRMELGGIFAPLVILSLFIKAQWVVQGSTFLFGVVFFSDPLLQQGIAILNEKIPDWPKYLEIRNTLLKGVPTNAQLTITLLRIGEANRAPIPPPPSSDEAPPDVPADLDKQKMLEESGLDASQSEVEDAITVDHPPAGAEDNEPVEQGQTPKKKSGFGAKIMSAFKHTTAGAVETKLTVDSGRAALGSGHAKQKLGILPSKNELRKKDVEGPIEFKGRFKGKKGAVYVDSSVSPASGNRPESPCVYFTTELDQNEIVESMRKDPLWSISIREITEVKKIGGLGWKGRLVVGWATDREIKDSIEITDSRGRTVRTTALKERDELFNRLVAMGQQVWESY